MNKGIKFFLKQELKKDAEQILSEVEQNSAMEEIEPTPEMESKLFQKVREYEAEKTEERFSEEDKRYIYLGKVYERRRRRRKYEVAAAACVAVLAIGITSVGGPERVLQEFRWRMAGKEQITTNSGDHILNAENSSEDEVYEQIEEQFGFTPVRMYYLPEGMDFRESMITDEIQQIQIIYGPEENRSLVYQIKTNYKEGSASMNQEDTLIDEFTVTVRETEIAVKQYRVEEAVTERWWAQFQYKNIQYLLRADGLDKEEFMKIVENLNFL